MAARRPSEHLRRSMPVDGGSSSTLGGVVGRKGSTPEHSAWSRELYLSAATSFTVGRSRKLSCAAAGSGRPERLRSRPESLTTRQGPYLRTPKPGFAVASAKLASWFAVWVGVHRGIGLTGKERAELGQGYRHISARTGNNCSSHLGGPGEPSGATWRPRGHPRRPPECPDGHGRLRRHFPGWEKG